MVCDKNKINRRRFLQILAFGAGTGSLIAAGMGCSRSDVRCVSETRILMGTLVNIAVMRTNDGLARSAVHASINRMSELESVLSRFDQNSQVSHLNRTGFIDEAHPALLELLKQARYVSVLSGGAFDITVKPLVELYQERHRSGGLPCEKEIEETLQLVDYRNITTNGTTVRLTREGMGITLDGMAKGYIVDAGISVLRKEGFGNVLVEAGGDLVASGFNESGQQWKIGIQSPRSGNGEILETIHVQDRGVATSGDYQQAFSADLEHHHIIDPRSGRSPRRVASVTITAPTAALADGLSTAVMVLCPEDGARMIGEIPQCDGVLVTKDMEVLRI